MAAYKTIAAPAEAEIVEKKSRFIGQIAPVSTEEEALAFIAEVKAAHRMARHNVYAYVLRGGRVRYTDDGGLCATFSFHLGRIFHTKLSSLQKTGTKSSDALSGSCKYPGSPKSSIWSRTRIYSRFVIVRVKPGIDTLLHGMYCRIRLTGTPSGRFSFTQSSS